ncbi:MAG TPA: hypothetical protein VJU15_10340 [Gemmatimonadales bacterium]|nr:hypothetical protein [Gemmatimonadales bacterium]
MSRTLVAVVAVALTACGGARKAAERAIASADSSIAAISAEAGNVAPELLQPLTAAVNDAKASFANKDYEKAAGQVTDIPARAAEARAKLEQTKKDLAADFATLNEAMPRNLEAVKARLAKPPRSLSRERLTELKGTYDSAMVAWPAIAQEFQGGAMASAMGKAFALKTRVSEAMVALGLSSDGKAWGNLITQPK